MPRRRGTVFRGTVRIWALTCLRPVLPQLSDKPALCVCMSACQHACVWLGLWQRKWRSGGGGSLRLFHFPQQLELWPRGFTGASLLSAGPDHLWVLRSSWEKVRARGLPTLRGCTKRTPFGGCWSGSHGHRLAIRRETASPEPRPTVAAWGRSSGAPHTPRAQGF